MEKTCIWVITPGGLKTGMKIMAAMPAARFLVSRSIADSYEIPEEAKIFESLKEKFRDDFRRYKSHVCIFSTGIAVRIAAPLLDSKLTDPALVVVDDRARHAISLLSGHLGGANELTLKISRITGATPVITTATDINNLPSVDMIAKKNGLLIENPGCIKKINMAFLKDEKIILCDPMAALENEIPEEFITDDGNWSAALVCTDLENLSIGDRNDLPYRKAIDGISEQSDRADRVPRETLILRPQSLVAGIGCNRGTTKEELMELLMSTFKERNLSLKSLSQIATTSVKQDEDGLLKMAEHLKLPLKFYEKSELNSVTTIQNPSAMVEKHLGVKSVCEAAAILAAQNGELIVPKIKKGNATIAVARINMRKTG